jgi:sec-independent protein translocase protein TatB
MFDIGGMELLVIAIVAIIVVGPKELPRMLRTLGQFVGKAKMMAREFQTHFNEAAEEAGLDEVRKGITNPDFGDTFKPITDVGKDIKREIEKPEASRSGADASGDAATAIATAVTAKAPDEAEKKSEPEKKAEAGSTGDDATPATS